MRFEPKISHVARGKGRGSAGHPDEKAKEGEGGLTESSSGFTNGVGPADVSESITPFPAQHPRLCVATTTTTTATTINAGRDKDHPRLSEVNKTKHLSPEHLLLSSAGNSTFHPSVVKYTLVMVFWCGLVSVVFLGQNGGCDANSGVPVILTRHRTSLAGKRERAARGVTSQWKPGYFTSPEGGSPPHTSQPPSLPEERSVSVWTVRTVFPTFRNSSA